MNANDDYYFTPQELAITPFDCAEHLDSVETINAYFAALLDEGDAKALAAGIDDIARAKEMLRLGGDSAV